MDALIQRELCSTQSRRDDMASAAVSVVFVFDVIFSQLRILPRDSFSIRRAFVLTV